MSGNDKDNDQTKQAQIQIINDRIIAVNLEVNNLLELVKKFDHLTSDCNDYRYIEEMLTRSILVLDSLECGKLDDLRQKRKSTCRTIEKVSEILKKKLDLNIDLADLTRKLGSHLNGDSLKKW